MCTNYLDERFELEQRHDRRVDALIELLELKARTDEENEDANYTGLLQAWGPSWLRRILAKRGLAPRIVYEKRKLGSRIIRPSDDRTKIFAIGSDGKEFLLFCL